MKIKNWVAYMNTAGMVFALFGGVMLMFNGSTTDASVIYALSLVGGIAMAGISYLAQLSAFRIIDPKKLSQAVIFWCVEMIMLMMIFMSYRNGKIAGVEHVLLRQVPAGVLLVAAHTLFFKKVVTLNDKALDDVVGDKNTEYMNKDERRYTMMISSFKENGSDVEVTGVIHGEAKSGDDVVLIQDDQTETVVHIKDIRKDDVSYPTVKDSMAVVVLTGCSAADVEKFSVLASVKIHGQRPMDNNENPLLLGMTYEYAQYCRNYDFMTRFIKVLVHSRFTVPVVFNPVDAQGHTQIGFMAVDRKGTDGSEEKSFALFSDGQALKSWKMLYKEGKGPNMMCITFQDAVSIMRKNGQSMVINPFGPVYVYLPIDLINMITGQQAYRDEFGIPGTQKMSFDADKDRDRDQ